MAAFAHRRWQRVASSERLPSDTFLFLSAGALRKEPLKSHQIASCNHFFLIWIVDSVRCCSSPSTRSHVPQLPFYCTYRANPLLLKYSQAVSCTLFVLFFCFCPPHTVFWPTEKVSAVGNPFH